MKYIDADLLRKKIAEQMDSVPREVGRGAGTITSKGYGMMEAFQIMRSIVDFLQQEQPEPSNNLVDVDAVREDFITEVYRVLDADPTNDRANAIINAFDSLPTVSQEQPEVDFKIEERKWVHNAVDNVFPEDGDFMSEVDFRKILKDTARHFAKWQKEQMMKEAVEGCVSAVILRENRDEVHYAITYPVQKEKAHIPLLTKFA